MREIGMKASSKVPLERQTFNNNIVQVVYVKRLWSWD